MPTPSLRFRLAWFGLVATLALTPRAAMAQGPIKWAFKPGETLKFAFMQSNDIKVTVNGQQQSNKSELGVDLTWTVKSVAADGSAQLTQTVQRAHAKITANGMTINYDSKDKTAADPAAQALAKVYDAVVGQPYTLKMTPQGEVTEVQVPEGVTAALAGSPFQAMADSGSFLSPAGVKNMLAQVLPRLSNDAVAKGATWTNELKLPTAPLTMNLKTTYTLANPGPRATIDSLIDTAITIEPGAQATVTIDKQTGTGKFHFNTTSGHLDDSMLNQSFDMTIKVNGTDIAQTISISSSLKLVP